MAASVEIAVGGLVHRAAAFSVVTVCLEGGVVYRTIREGIYYVDNVLNTLVTAKDAHTS